MGENFDVDARVLAGVARYPHCHIASPKEKSILVVKIK
jgi:hypothetical protein